MASIRSDTATGPLVEALEDADEALRDAIMFNNIPKRFTMDTVKRLFEIDEVDQYSGF